MKFWITVAGREDEVEVHAEGGRVLLSLGGRTLEADSVRLPDGEVYSLLVAGRSHVVRVSPGDEALEVAVRGAVIPVEVRHPLERLLGQQGVRRGATQGETIAAPMPGVVVAVRVAPGDRVEAGQPVVVIEAMKMQNELVAHRGGVVGEVLVAERAAVGAGQALLRLRPEADA